MELFLLLFFLIPVAIGFAALAFWIWVLIDCATKEPDQGNDKLIWILIIVFLNWIGGLLYLIVRRPQRIAEYGR